MSPSRIFHFSEIENITVFTPRPVTIPSERPPGQQWLNGPLVWAVNERRQATYLFPRDCPRVVLWATEETTDRDRRRWIGDSTAAMVAHVEKAWMDQLGRQVLFRYELPHDTFEPTVDPWMLVSRSVVTPSAIERIDDLLTALRHQSVELRVSDDLVGLRDAWSSSVHASGIRLRHARGWSVR